MNDEQLLRYSRQIMLADIDIEGQEKLLAARVLIVGLGGLGSPVAMYLAAAGVGHLMLADFDLVDLTNLQRQIVHSTASVGESKAQSAARRLAEINPTISLEILDAVLNAENLSELVKGVTLVVDCSDNFSTRFAINAACVANKIPLVSGAAIGLEGQISVFDARQPDSPCYACLYDSASEQDTSCAANGVLAPLVGVIGSLQAVEAIKLIAGFGKSLTGKLILFDARYLQWRELRLHKDNQCAICGSNRCNSSA